MPHVLVGASDQVGVLDHPDGGLEEAGVTKMAARSRFNERRAAMDASLFPPNCTAGRPLAEVAVVRKRI